METLLDEYLTGTFHSDRQEITELENYIIDASRTLVDAFDKDKGMPYTVRHDKGAIFGNQVSQSTTAMVAVSMWRLLGLLPVRPDSFATTHITSDLKLIDESL